MRLSRRHITLQVISRQQQIRTDFTRAGWETRRKMTTNENDKTLDWVGLGMENVEQDDYLVLIVCFWCNVRGALCTCIVSVGVWVEW